MCRCVCARTCEHVCVYMHMYTYMCILLRLWGFSLVCVHVCLCECMPESMCADVHVCVRIHSRSHVCVCVCVKGKGFPDVGTRLLLWKIWDQFRLPIFALVDADPHGTNTDTLDLLDSVMTPQWSVGQTSDF